MENVGIIGLGYVGLPLAVAFAEAGASVTGVDVDPGKVAALHAGESYVEDVPPERIRAAAGRLRATTDYAELREAGAALICLPTPLDEHREPDLSVVVAGTEAVAENLSPGALVVLESTTYPGTTREVLLPILERGGRQVGRDFHLAFSPERVDPGNRKYTLKNTPKVVGGVTPGCAARAVELYGLVSDEVHSVSGPESAEMSKLLENVFRGVNIALVNELAILCDRMGVDVWEVIEAASTKPFGFMPFYPGPGLGGHCLVGGETVRVRNGKTDNIMTLSELFEQNRDQGRLLEVDGTEVLLPDALETVALEPETGTPAWRRVSCLFRRRYRGDMVEVKLAGNRRLRVTDRHPFLVVEGDRATVREARDLEPGVRVPFFRGGLDAEEAEANPVLNLPSSDSPRAIRPWKGAATTPVEEVRTVRGDEPVYSVEVPGWHTFLTSGGVFVHNCIPIDPFYLSWRARAYDMNAEFIELAGRVNVGMPYYALGRISSALNDDEKPVKGSRVLILGMSYKPDVGDLRESPSVKILELLEKSGARVAYHDPYVPELPAHGLSSVKLTRQELEGADCAVIVTDHSAVDLRPVVELVPKVVDLRNAVRKRFGGPLPSNVEVL